MTATHLLFRKFLLIFLLLAASLPALADEPSNGYQMAMLDERAQNPQKVLTQQKLSPSDATVREFEWLLETLRNRCRDPENTIVTTLVETWRTVQRRGYKVTLLQVSRQIADLSNIAFPMMRNKKLEIGRVVNKVLIDKYPEKK